MTKYDLVCPLAEKDVDFYFKVLGAKAEFLDINRFVVIGNSNVRKKVEEYDRNDVVFVDEDQLVSYAQVKTIIASISNNDRKCIRRTGWYLQQFLKFSYAQICTDEYYLLWDADTVPIHRHTFFEGDKIIFDMKSEHHEPYFESFSRLFPMYEKRNPLSYISEHMMIKASIMRELIQELSESKVSGAAWYEKVMNSVDPIDLPYSGFSDYETYGLFCLHKYPDLYRERKWDSLRPAARYFEFEKMRPCDYEWLLKDYDAVTFEAHWRTRKLINAICRSKYVQEHFSCKKLLNALHQFTI